MKTARGVYLNLFDSDYYIDINGLRFYFSSKFNRDRFNKNILTFVEQENLKIVSRYHVNINLSLFLMLSYYKKIEKRGFRIKELSTNKEIEEDSRLINTIL